MKIISCLLIALIGSIQAQDDVIDKLGELGATQLLAYIESAGLTEALRGEGPFTIFAPSNAAIDALPEEIKDLLDFSPDFLTGVLTFHVTPDSIPSSSLSNELLLPTLQDSSNRINIYSTTGAVTATGSAVSTTDVEASNGIVHVLDSMIFRVPDSTIIDEVFFDADLNTLSDLLGLAGLDSVLAGEGPFTLFAPTDAAFDKLPIETIIDLIANPERLNAVLLYHVVPSTQYSKGLVNGEVATVEGSNVVINIGDDGSVSVNDAIVEFADYPATNGVIHYIDTVLIPDA